MTDARVAKPPPAGIAIDVNVWTAPFWQAAAEQRLIFARCARCGQMRMPPTPFCPNCRSQAIDWLPATNDAVLYSYTVVERAVVPGTEESLPYVPAIVEFAALGRVRLISNIVGSRLSDLRVGAPLLLNWHRVDEARAIPIFRIDIKTGGSE